jgi:hypothetical protein
MSKRSPFWQAFSTQTPLGYAIAGYFNTEPGPAYGAIRFTHVDGTLTRPFTTPGLPVLTRASVADLSVQPGTVDCRAIERADGTLVGFYPLFNPEGELVEVVPRTVDMVVVADTPWRPLARLIRQVHHAGIEEAVRRQRGVFVFSLIGCENARVVRQSVPLRLLLHGVVRGSGRALATFGQLRSWANHYGLDLPATRLELDPRRERAALAAEVGTLLCLMEQRTEGAPPGEWEASGLVLWTSGRAGVDALDLPVGVAAGAPGICPLDVWDAMARLADHAVVPTRDRTTASLATAHPNLDSSSLGSLIAPHWERWARAFPEAFTGVAAQRVAV